MVNKEQFAKRLKEVIDFYDESASSFAEKIGVQRSSISHILSGRNNPSLDFVLKIIDTYPSVDLYWLIHGKGHFPKNETPEPKQPTDLFSEIPTSPSSDGKGNAIQQISSTTAIKEIEKNIPFSSTEIDRIVIFYKNGTFTHYKN